ncbi:alpha/beta fold hydrolase [Marinilactibacillus psychrotolerans]|uniref:alpha/beta fold hydrolase n=1 Tax=Marinilactibacillus psychrotolerans TaxID=191770 RepID=UPI0039AEF869
MRKFLIVNKNKVELFQKGDTGTPIIIISGMGCSLDEWHEVTESLSKTNRILMFHRPGLGESEIGNEVRSTQTVANELTDIMRQLNLSEPAILVGHSYGGLCVQHFAKKYPEKVAGIVLVDSTSVDLKELDELDLPVLDEGETDESWMEKSHSYSLMERDELKKIINPTLTEKQRQLPLDIQQRLLDFQINPFMYKAMYSEISNWKNDAKLIKNLGNFPDIPLIVIGRDKEHSIKSGALDGLPEWELRLLEEKWQELVMNQANLTQNGEFLLAKNSSHSIHIDRPNMIIDSVSKIIERLINK